MAVKGKKGDTADPKKKASKNRVKLSSWEREYGDRAVKTKTRAGVSEKVYYDVEGGKWLPGSGPAYQVKRSTKNTKRKASKGKKGTPYNAYAAAPNR